MNEEWKKGFHNKLNDYETTPPQGLFDEILKHIPPFKEGEKAPNKPIEVSITLPPLIAAIEAPLPM